jgi:hypothetical protein
LRNVVPVALSAIAFLTLSASGRADDDDRGRHDRPGREEISIAEARALPIGTVVTVSGSVTVPSGKFSSSLLDQGFAIQDYTGGIYVSTAKNLRLDLQDQVRVTGELSNLGQLVLIPKDRDDVDRHGDEPKVQALRVATGAVGAATAGKLVKVVAPIVEPIFNDLPFGYIVVVNDGSGPINVYVKASNGIDIRGLRQGKTIEVTGFGGQFDQNYEIDVRFQRDIKVVSYK